MPQEKADVDPMDVTGIPLTPNEINQSGEPQGTANVASALGLKPEDLEEDKEEDDEEKPPQKVKEEAPKSEEDPNKLGEKYAEFVQRNAEEAYANALHRAKTEEGYLASLSQSKDAMDQRIMKKLLERNDFGAKTIEEYRRNVRTKEIGDDPVKLKLAELEDRQTRFEQGSAEKEWSQWKQENAVRGKAAELADDVHSRYPDMPLAEVMETVKGKMGGEYSASQKQHTSALIGGDGIHQEDSLGIGSVNPNLVNALLPNRKKTVKFAKQYVREIRR